MQSRYQQAIAAGKQTFGHTGKVVRHRQTGELDAIEPEQSMDEDDRCLQFGNGSLFCDIYHVEYPLVIASRA